ncbi:MAG: protein kinase domain-containing protein [bacterium]
MQPDDDTLLERFNDPDRTQDVTVTQPDAARFGATMGPADDGAEGRVVGPYVLHERLGEGGFGVVYRAEQAQPVRRRVALKIIKPGMDSRDILQRFEQERQALAIMDHPGIAKVFDAGTTESARPYFVMEYVDGRPIAEFCDARRLGVRERLELFLSVCAAVQHAHQKGVIHRDLKPSNILVAEGDDGPTAKIIDFGIAKATEQKLTEQTLMTAVGQFIGTPAYMSPEQASGALDVDTRSDIYSLGAVLYELLTGATPVNQETLRRSSLEDLLRTIREVDPPTPSARLSGAGDAPANADVANRRGMDARRLVVLVRGDLDWISMKALEKDRTRRYESAAALAADVQRFLNSEPVLAAPPSLAYRARKFAARHKAPVIGASIVLIALVAGLASTLWQARVAEQARDSAVSQQKRAELVAGFLSDLITRIDPEVSKGRDITLLKSALDSASVRLQSVEVRESPEAEVYLRQAIGTAYSKLGLNQEAIALMTPAVPLSRALVPRDQAAHANLVGYLANAVLARGDFAGAESLFRESLEARGRQDPVDSLLIADIWIALAGVHKAQNDNVRAQEEARSVIAFLDRAAPEHEFLRAQALHLIGISAQDGGDPAAAVEPLRECIRLSERIGSVNVTQTLNALASALQDLGQIAEAESTYRRTIAAYRRFFPEGHMSLAITLNNIASLYEDRGEFTEAEEASREAVALFERFAGREVYNTANTRARHGRALAGLRRFAEAEAELLEAARVFEIAPGVPEQRRLRCIESLAALYDAWDAAEPGRGHAAQAAKWRARHVATPSRKAAS